MSKGMTPAALMALLAGLDGDPKGFDNFAAASTPGGIEAQEAAGQQRICSQERLTQLPADVKIGYNTPEVSREMFAKYLGFKWGRQIDQAFMEVIDFPAGWRLEPTGHSMWNTFYDDKGRKRGSMFFKAAFYDYNATLHIDPRFIIGHDYEKKADGQRDYDRYNVVVIDNGFGSEGKEGENDTRPRLWTGNTLVVRSDWDSNDQEGSRKRYNECEALQKRLRGEAAEHLKSLGYPEFENPLMYWE